MAEKYITLNKDGKDYRAIANMMTKAGYSMNHATARNVLMSGMATFIKDVSSQMGKPLSEEELFTVINNQDTYDALVVVLEQAYNQLKQENAPIP